LPSAIADSTALMKVRIRLIREWLMSSRRLFRRIRFLACGVFAILSYVLIVLNEKAAQDQTAAPTRSFPYSERPLRSTFG
jgi:hypothetical protein